jgi:PAS domain S-box-containing protein
MSDGFDTTGANWRVAPDLLSVLSRDGVFRSVSPAWRCALGRGPEDLVARPLADFVHPEDADAMARALDRVRPGAPDHQFEARLRHADGGWRRLCWSAMAHDGLLVCTARDVTDARAAQEDLRARAEEAKLREGFIAVLGHDLRNPLAAVISALRIVRRDPSGPRAAEVVELAGHAAVRMSAMVDDLLDFARARLDGGLGIDAAQEVALRDVIEQTVEELRVSHPEARVVTRYRHLDPTACDPDRIGQLVSNLIGNAVAHGEPGRPVLIETHDEGDATVVSVSNRGRTIPPERRATLFEPFTAAAGDDRRRGLGLGLYIARSIAAGHGGTLDVRSEDGTTTFTLRLPRPRAGPRPPINARGSGSGRASCDRSAD